MQLYSNPHSLLTLSLGLRKAFYVYNFEAIKKISWVECSWMLSCKASHSGEVTTLFP